MFSRANCEFSALSFNVSVCVYLVMLARMSCGYVRMTCFTILCIFTYYMYNFMQSVGKCVCLHTQTIKILYSIINVGFLYEAES